MNTIGEDIMGILERELSDYKEGLSLLSINEVIDKSYETTIKEEIVVYVQTHSLLEGFIHKLRLKESPLEYLYNEYMKSDSANIFNEITNMFATLQFMSFEFV